MSQAQKSTKGLRPVQVCEETGASFRMKVPSQTEEGKFYEVSGVIGNSGMISCSCPAFLYKKTCKHVELSEVSCGWRSDAGEEVQTFYQAKGHVCPRCGGKTVDTLGKVLQK